MAFHDAVRSPEYQVKIILILQPTSVYEYMKEEVQELPRWKLLV